ncbi:MAG: hypothetical protein PHF69_07155, partial [Candidatus Omnitrophica bacterium]|nr:hypothetical protein [Candidatus Omnitrophota bacterium]
AITSSTDYSFKDQRSKALNEYSTQLIRELIIPKLTKEVNSSKRYASLRQVYYSLILAQWFKARHKQGLSPQGTVPVLIDSKNLTDLISRDDWSKTTYFNAYKKSFAEGEYNIQEPHYTPTGQVIRSYFSGGEMLGLKNMPEIGSSPINKQGETAISIIPASTSSSLFKSGFGKILPAILIGISLLVPGDRTRINNFNLNGAKITVSDHFTESRHFGDDEDSSKELQDLMPLLKVGRHNPQAINKVMRLIKNHNYSYGTMVQCIFYLRNTLLGETHFVWGGHGPPTGYISKEPTIEVKKAILNVLLGLLESDKLMVRRQAIESLKVYTNKIVLELRLAHLIGRIPNSELKKRLEESVLGNNFLIYLCYTSPENFTDLASIILHKLDSQANSKGEALGTFLSDLDPKKIFYRDFILQLANFSHLQRLFSTPKALYGIMDYLFKGLSREDVNIYSVRLALFTDNIIDDKGFAYQKEFQRYLRGLYDRASGLNRRLITALLTVYHDKLDYLDRDDISDIARIEGIRLEDMQVPYDKLFKDSKLVVHIVFVDSDAISGHYSSTSEFFQGKNKTYPGISSYKAVLSTRNQTILEKGNIRIILIRADREEYDINEHFNDVGVVISRSHSGKETAVFKDQPSPLRSQGKIFFVSSCRSATVIGNLSRFYPGADFIGVNSIAEGMKTNIAIYYLLEALQKRVATFTDISDFVKSHFREGAKDYVLPGDPSLRVYKIIANSSSSPVNKGDIFILPDEDASPAAGSPLGGIDFRFLPIVTQAVTNLSVNLRDSPLRRQSLQRINLDVEWQAIERMSSSGIKPSSERIKEYAQASSVLGKISQDKDKIILCISDILRQEEEQCCETDPILRDILVVLESVQQPQELKEVFLGKV